MNKIDTSVLYVEDDNLSRSYAEKMLSITVEKFEVAHNGKEALEKILSENFLPEYIITDLKMPDMNGLDMIAMIKKIKSYNPKIIVITGHSEIDTLDDILKNEIVEIFQKPIDFAEILKCIKETKEMK